jgi:tetratricopeptide (TPR) repeat protein
MKKRLPKIPLSVVTGYLPILLILLLLCVPLFKAVEWNIWSLHVAWHALKPSDTYQLEASLPAGHDQGLIWLAQNALSNGEPQRTLQLIEPLASINSPFVTLIQAQAMEQQGDFAVAIQKLSSLRTFSLLIELGNGRANAGDRSNALAAYRAAYTINPLAGTSPLANYLTATGDLAGADAVIRTALSDYPYSPLRNAWFKSLGDNLRKQKLFDESEAVYQADLNENPKDWSIMIGLGWVYYERGDGLQKASDEFEKAILLDSSGTSYYMMAQLLTRASRFSDADIWYRKALQIDQKNCQWMIGRGNNMLAGGNIDQAMLIYQSIDVICPEYPPAYYEMANAYKANNQPEEARNAIEKALNLMKPPSDFYYLRAGQIYEWRGEKTLALDAYEKALTINPANTLARQALDRLNTP